MPDAAPQPSVMEQIVSLCKRRGFVYQCGEIYGGTRSAWDYGPLGVELKENIKRQWWRSSSGGDRRRALGSPAARANYRGRVNPPTASRMEPPWQRPPAPSTTPPASTRW